MIWNLNRKEHEEELIEGSVCLRHLKKSVARHFAGCISPKWQHLCLKHFLTTVRTSRVVNLE